jgi:hypothetical protein
MEKRPECLSEEELKKAITDSIEQGTFRFARSHGQGITVQEHLRKRGITLKDARRICQNGKLKNAEWNKEREKWRYVMEGTDYQDETTEVVITFDERAATVITAF